MSNAASVSSKGRHSASAHGQTTVLDSPPHLTRSLGDIVHAGIALICGIIVLLTSSMLQGVTSGVESDAHTAVRSVDWLMNLPASMLQQLVTVMIVMTVLVHLLTSRAWAQSAMSVIALFVGYVAAWALSMALFRIGDTSMLSTLDSLEFGPQTMLLPDIYAGLGAFLTMAGPQRTRSSVKWGWSALLFMAVLLVAVLWYSVAGTLVSLAVGRTVGSLLRFASGTMNQGIWGNQIVQALRSIGLDPRTLSRRDRDSSIHAVPTAVLDDDLIDGSRLYDMTTRDDERYVVSVLDSQIHVAGYLNQLWQWVRLRGIPVRRDRSVFDANHHHLSMILGLAHVGLPTPRVYGTADSGESSLLVLPADGTPHPYDASMMDDAAAVAFMTYLDTANRRGYTHRHITPASLAILQDGTPIIAGWQNGDCASANANITVDRAQIIILLSACMGVERTIANARQVWDDDVLLSLSPFIQRAAVPMGTRALPECTRQLISSVRSSLQALAADDADTVQTVSISRFSLKSFITIALSVVAVAVVFTQLRPDDVIAAVRNAKPIMAGLCVVLSIVAWMGSALTLGIFIDKERRDWPALFITQIASGLTAVSMPAGVGPAFVNFQHLRRRGLRSADATAATSATWAVQGLTTILLTIVIGLFTGRNTLSGAIPTNTLIIVIGIVTLAFCLAMIIAPIRRLITDKYLPLAAVYARRFIDILARPDRLVIGFLGAVILNLATALSFWVALMAFGTRTNPVETIFVFLLANTLASAVPTPGGLGAVEAALTLSFSGMGVPAGIALSATLLYRVVFYWLRIPAGAVAMRWLSAHEQI